MYVLRNDPVIASETEIANRANGLLEYAESRKWLAKEAMFTWTCATANIIAALAENKEELNTLLKVYTSYLVSTAAQEFKKRNP